MIEPKATPRSEGSNQRGLMKLVVFGALGLAVGLVLFKAEPVSRPLQLGVAAALAVAIALCYHGLGRATVFSVGILVILGLRAGAESGMDSLSTIESMPFDSIVWASAEKDYPTPDGSPPRRQRMARDLIASERLIGLTREQVVALLGPPEDLGERWPMSYFLGPPPFIPIDNEHLGIEFDAQGQVSRVFVLVD